MKPVIGISMNLSTANDERRMISKGVEMQYLQFHYIDFVEQQGGLPLLIPSLERAEDITELVKRLDGVIIVGGEDVDPTLYGEENRHSLGCNPKRDVMELNLIKEARYQEKAILGICRGHQMLNIAFGGSLYQDILTDIEGAQKHSRDATEPERFHTALIIRKSSLSEVFSSEEIEINSSHHQSVKSIGQGLVAIAAAKDGVIEAIECPTDRCTVGVQWHPERIQNQADQKKLAEWFISKAANI